jgi:hypothetical protein
VQANRSQRKFLRFAVRFGKPFRFIGIAILYGKRAAYHAIYFALTAPFRITGLLRMPPCAGNPAPVLEKDGSISLYYRAYNLREKKGTGNDTTRVLTWPGEFIDKRGYDMIFNNKFNDQFNPGGFAFSADGKKFAPQKPVYSREVRSTDGSSEMLNSRERPCIIWITDKEGVLYTGIRPKGKSDKSYVLAVPVVKVYNR